MGDLLYVTRPFRILCLIVLLSISIWFEISSEAVDATPKKKTVLGNEASIVRSLVIDGNESFSEQQIRALMRTDVWSLYDETVLESDLEAIVRFYRENGYRFARVDEEQLSVKKFADGVYLGIEIDEGRVGNIIVTGNIKTKEDVIRRELLFMQGDIYTEADREESEQILRRKTYIGAAKVDAQWDELSESVAIHATIRELLSFPFGGI